MKIHLVSSCFLKVGASTTYSLVTGFLGSRDELPTVVAFLKEVKLKDMWVASVCLCHVFQGRGRKARQTHDYVGLLACASCGKFSILVGQALHGGRSDAERNRSLVPKHLRSCRDLGYVPQNSWSDAISTIGWKSVSQDSMKDALSSLLIRLNVL